MAIDMPPGIEHMHAAEVEGNIQSIDDAIQLAKRIANQENPDEETGRREIEGKGSKTSITWEKKDGAGTLVAHIVLEKDGRTEKQDVSFVDMTRGASQNPVYVEEGMGPVASK